MILKLNVRLQCAGAQRRLGQGLLTEAVTEKTVLRFARTPSVAASSTTDWWWGSLRKPDREIMFAKTVAVAKVVRFVKTRHFSAWRGFRWLRTVVLRLSSVKSCYPIWSSFRNSFNESEFGRGLLPLAKSVKKFTAFRFMKTQDSKSWKANRKVMRYFTTKFQRGWFWKIHSVNIVRSF